MMVRIINHCWVLCGLLCISACQTLPERNHSTSKGINNTIDESLRQAQQAAREQAGRPPPPISAALLPPVTTNRSSVVENRVEPRFSITVNRAEAKLFFMSLVKDTPYNMVVHPSVTGKISLHLKGVTVGEVMETIRDVYGYDYRRTGIGFEVLETGLRSKIFKINYLNMTRSGMSQIQVSSGQISAARSNNSTTSNNSKGRKQSNTSQAGGLSGSRVDTRSKSDFWGELKATLQTLVGVAEGRSVVVNQQSGLIVVRAMPNELRIVEDYLTATQKIIQRQVILEAKILEVSLSDDFQAGINWAALGSFDNTTALLGQTGGGTVFSGSGTSGIAGNMGILDPSALQQIQGTATSAFGGMFSLALNTGDFTTFIELLKTQGDVHVLSSPRISTLNNEKAIIKVGSDDFFITNVSTQTNTSNSTSNVVQTVNLELTPFFSGVALDVIPQIDEHNQVILHIHPSVSEVTERVKQINVTVADSFSIPLAHSSIRESDSIVRARSGQVIVIGGLMQNIIREEVVAVPLLSSIPIIGHLFRHTKRSLRKSELVILLRPIVVADAVTWADQVEQAAAGLRRWSRGAPKADHSKADIPDSKVPRAQERSRINSAQ